MFTLLLFIDMLTDRHYLLAFDKRGQPVAWMTHWMFDLQQRVSGKVFAQCNDLTLDMSLTYASDDLDIYAAERLTYNQLKQLRSEAVSRTRSDTHLLNHSRTFADLLALRWLER